MGHELGFFVLGEFKRFTLNCEENYFGGIQIYSFLRIWADSHVRALRRGDTMCALCAC
jgi:hypothetical protein